MKKIRKNVTILLFLLFSGMIIFMCTHLTMRPMELSTPANSEDQHLGSSTARYDFKQIFNFYEDDTYHSCEIQGNYLYTVGMPSFTIFNITVPTAIVKVASLPALGRCFDLDIEGNFAYVLSEVLELMVINISDPASPQLIGSFSAVNNPRQIKVVGNVAYVCHDNSDFTIVNITSSDPQNFTVLDTIGSGGVQDVEIVDDVAYVCNGRLNSNVGRFNISDPTNIINIWPLLEVETAMAIKVVGGFAYIAAEFDGLVVYNVTDPDAPVKIGSYVDVGGAYDIEIQSNVAYIADGFDGLELLDISNPANPRELGGFTIGRACLRVRVLNETIYLLHGDGFFDAGDEITVLQADYNVLHPEGIAQVVDGCYRLDLKDDLLLLAYRTLKIYNVSDHTNLTHVGDYYGSSQNIYNVKVDGNLAYVLRTDSGTSQGLQILNISDPSSPIGLGSYASVIYDGGLAITQATWSTIEIRAPLLFILTSPELLILNVSNPLAPTKLSSIPGSALVGVAVQGDLVYLGDSSQTEVWNISNPALPVVIHVNTSYGDPKLSIEGDLLYLSGYFGGYGFHIANISDPTNIAHIASYSPTTGGSLRTFVVDADFAYICSDPKLDIVNLSDPFNPDLLGDRAFGDMITDLTVQGNYVYAAYGSEGFKIIRIDEDTDFDGIIDYREVYELNTNPSSADSDQDGLPDGAELNTYNTDPLDVDSDNDGLSDGSEILTYGTDPTLNDTDTDGIYDQEEVIYGVDGYITDPTLADTDGDGVEDLEEMLLGIDNFITNPILNDTDADGMTDGWEVQYNLTPTSDLDATQDFDGDKITNLQEFQIDSNPTTAFDNDSDLIADDWELFYLIDNPLADNDSDNLNALEEFNAGTNPLSNDTDADIMDDHWEVSYGCNPLINDAIGDLDNDDLINLQEYYIGTNPSISDTDGDGFKDGFEVSSGTDPLDKNDHPPNIYFIIIIVIIIIGVIAALMYLRITGRIWRKAPINVFISHAIPDYETYKVKELAEHISHKKPINRSFHCEEDLQFNIDEWMEQTVPLSQILIFIATENSIISKDCTKELRLARKHNLFIVPLKDIKLSWAKLSKLKLNRELGFNYNLADHSETFNDVSTYIDKFKADLDKLYVELRKSKTVSVQKLEHSLDLSENQIRKLINTLEKNAQIKGAWSIDNRYYISEKEVKRRIKTINELHLTDSIEEILEKAELHPDYKAHVEEILKSKQETKHKMQKKV